MGNNMIESLILITSKCNIYNFGKFQKQTTTTTIDFLVLENTPYLLNHALSEYFYRVSPK